LRPLKKTKRIAPADAGAFFEEAEKPCTSGKIFCVKNADPLAILENRDNLKVSFECSRARCVLREGRKGLFN
jgi:hypothetical protein